MLKNGDRVIVISRCGSKGQKGIILHDVNYFNGYTCVTVQLESGVKRNYNPISLEKIYESEDISMTGFKNVAIVNLLDDYSKKDYGFALYEEEVKLLKGDGDLVVVNARGKDNRILGVIKGIMSVEEYGKGVTAQVVGVVNMDGYNARIKEENRLKELAKKKAAIEKELEEEINKRKSVEYYEEMSKKYSNNPRLAELVEELKKLGV